MAWQRIVIEYGNDFLDGPSVEAAVSAALNIVRLGLMHSATAPGGQTDFNTPGQVMPLTVRYARQLLPTDPSRTPPPVERSDEKEEVAP